MRQFVGFFLVIVLSFVSFASPNVSALRDQVPSENQLRSMGVLFVAPQALVGNNCAATGASLSISGNAQEIIANIPQEARDKFEAQYPKVEAQRSVYEDQSGKNDIPWQVFAAIHYREGGNNPEQTPLNGQPYGENNVDRKGIISTPDQAYQISAEVIRGLSRVYGVENVTASTPLSIQDLAKIGVSYNRGNVYKKAFGQEEGPWHSPYVANYLDQQRIGMKFEGPVVNNVTIEGANLAGKADGNLGFVTFILLLYEKTGFDTSTVNGTGTNTFANDQTSPCNASGKALGATLDSIVYYSQKDPRWAEHPYPYPGDPNNAEDRTVATSGCGPTTMAMLIATMTNNKDVTPDKIADENLNGGFRDANGTTWGAFTTVLPRYGLEVRQMSDKNNTDELANELRNGALAIGSFGPGVFTTGGHILVIRGVTDGGKFLVADPNDKLPGNSEYQRKSTTEWDPSIIAGESKGIFIVRVAQ